MLFVCQVLNNIMVHQNTHLADVDMPGVWCPSICGGYLKEAPHSYELTLALMNIDFK